MTKQPRFEILTGEKTGVEDLGTLEGEVLVPYSKVFDGEQSPIKTLSIEDYLEIRKSTGLLDPSDVLISIEFYVRSIFSNAAGISNLVFYLERDEAGAFEIKRDPQTNAPPETVACKFKGDAFTLQLNSHSLF